jgi:malate/lactate dehydrogenase
MKIGIVGCGMVGATSGFALVMNGVGREGLSGCEGVTLGLPHLVGAQGALSTIPLRLDTHEQLGLQRCASILRDAIESLKLR